MNGHPITLNINGIPLSVTERLARYFPLLAAQYDNGTAQLGTIVSVSAQIQNRSSIDAFCEILYSASMRVEGFRLLGLEYTRDVLSILTQLGLSTTMKNGLFWFDSLGTTFKFKITVDMYGFCNGLYGFQQLQFFDTFDCHIHAVITSLDEFRDFYNYKEPIKHICSLIRYMNRDDFVAGVMNHINMTIDHEAITTTTTNTDDEASTVTTVTSSSTRRNRRRRERTPEPSSDDQSGDDSY